MYVLLNFIYNNSRAFLLGFLFALLGFLHAQPGAFTPYGLVNVRVANSSLLPPPSSVVNPAQILNLGDSMIWSNMGTGSSPWVAVYRFGTPLTSGYGLDLQQNMYWVDTTEVASINYSYSKSQADGLFVKTEIDPTVPAYVKAITTTEKSNWNTAYSWGNHNGLYPLLSGSYSNPSWITNLDWSKIINKPTTLSGYGITDAYPLIGNPSGFLTSYTETDPLFNTKFSSKTTSDLTEGSNLYYTSARFNTAFSSKSTTDLIEGTNLYWTPTRSNNALTSTAVNTALGYTAYNGALNPLGFLTTEVDGSVTNEIELPSQTGQSGKYLSTNGTNTTWITPPTLPGTNNYSAYASGTVYSLTSTSQKITFGTTSPTITIGAPGTYMLFADVRLAYNGLASVGARTSTVKIRRTNNTATDISNATSSFVSPIISVLSPLTSTAGDCDIPVILYTTANSNDNLELWGVISGGVLAAGSMDIQEASIVAVRIY